jgi:hypothetical protein
MLDTICDLDHRTVVDTQRDGPLRQLIGETHARVEMLVDAVRDLRTGMENKERDIQAELRTIKHDARSAEQIWVGRLELGDRRMGEIERRIGEAEKSMREMATLLQQVQVPLDQLLELKKRLWWTGALAISIATFVWVFVQPWYALVVHRLFPGGGGQ